MSETRFDAGGLFSSGQYETSFSMALRRAAGWDWAGVDAWSDEAAVGQIVRAVRQVISGEPIHPARPLAPLAIVGAVIGVILLLIILAGVAVAIGGGLF